MSPNVWWARAILAVDNFFCFGLASSKSRVGVRLAQSRKGVYGEHMTTVILVRHGQTAWNVNERFRGQADVPLDEVGAQQAERTAERIARQWAPAAVYCSPLSRARVTAEEIAAQCKVAVQVDRMLSDIDYGSWQGLTPEEARRRYPRQMRRWQSGSRWARPPGGESLRAVQRRCLEAVLHIASRHPEDVVVAVAHTVVNRLVLLGALAVGLRHFWHIGQDPCALNVIEIEKRSFTLHSVNDTCHLTDLTSPRPEVLPGERET